MAPEAPITEQSLDAVTSGQEWIKFRSHMLALQARLRFVQEERHKLAEELEAWRQNGGTMLPQLERLAQRNDELETLFIVSNRILSVNSRQELLAAVQDVVANVIGSEEMILFGVDPAAGILEPIAWCGIEVASWSRIAIGEGIIGQVAATGDGYLADDSVSDISSCTPITCNGRIIGVLAIFGMLPQKQKLDSVDFEVLQLLQTQVGTLLERFPTGEMKGEA